MLALIFSLTKTFDWIDTQDLQYNTQAASNIRGEQIVLGSFMTKVSSKPISQAHYYLFCLSLKVLNSLNSRFNLIRNASFAFNHTVWEGGGEVVEC